MNGILLVDKPLKLTSHDVVDRIRKAAGQRRVGHTGTLDPAATGLLILCLGSATRLSEMLTGLDKVYEGRMRLGLVTDSFDLDGTVIEQNPVPDLSIETIQQALAEYTGNILQVPPMVSAVKIGGERLYKKARKGETVPREPRPVTVREFVLLDYSPPEISFRVCCTRGTYVRSLCHDVGARLGCGATLAGLRRTWVGVHSVEQARPVEAFRSKDDILASLLPMEQALNLPRVQVRASARKTVLLGGYLAAYDLLDNLPLQEGWVQLVSERGELLALGQVIPDPLQVRIHAKRVLCEQP